MIPARWRQACRTGPRCAQGVLKNGSRCGGGLWREKHFRLRDAPKRCFGATAVRLVTSVATALATHLELTVWMRTGSGRRSGGNLFLGRKVGATFRAGKHLVRIAAVLRVEHPTQRAHGVQVLLGKLLFH